ncbi:SGNH/GDSL hydrolase family protein [Devosia alba]|uniref:SGNH/GDSL hydrolase family protein n=1 Tax=Devosia alba TaxID=3152360 RepID=UPI0032671E23
MAQDWIDTWAAAPQPVWGPDFLAPLTYPRNVWDQTVRQVARVSLGGKQVRIALSNEFGDRPMMVGEAHVALHDEGADTQAGSDRKLTFGGMDSITIPAGASVVSDAVELDVPALGSVAVSLYFPDVTPTTTVHNDGRQTAYIVAGNRTADVQIVADTTTTARLFLSGIAVDAPEDARAIVTFGDSITDGDGSTENANTRWPDVLAQRLQEAGGVPTAVLNEGISGQRVLVDRMGTNALARFEEAVLSHPKVETVIFMMGINDIGWPGSVLDPQALAPSAQDIIAGHRQIIARARDHGIRIIGATLTPFNNAFEGGPLEGFYSTDKEAVRVEVNEWIRNGGEYDAVIDFDELLQDPADPTKVLDAFDKGDNLHPNDAGYQAMAESIDLDLLDRD